MPILSVRKVIKTRNMVQFDEGGGFIENRKTGHKTKFYECDGIYFLKLLVDDPASIGQFMEAQEGKRNGSDFTRPGR